MKRVIFLIGMLFVLENAWAGGGWPQEKGGFFAKINQYSILSQFYFSPTGEVIDISRTDFHSFSVYGEYGITDKLTGILNAPLFVRSVLHEERDFNGTLIRRKEAVNSVGDIDVALKYNFLNKSGWVASAILDLGIPIGIAKGGNSGLLQTGDGEFNQLIEVYVSRSVGNGYFTFSTGFNNRTQSFSDEFRFGLEAGRKVKGFWGILRIYGIESLNNGTKPYEERQGIFTNNIEYLSISPEISYDVKSNWGVVVGAGFAAYGKNVMASPSLSLGVYLKSM